jgi:hypothetical protein
MIKHSMVIISVIKLMELISLRMFSTYTCEIMMMMMMIIIIIIIIIITTTNLFHWRNNITCGSNCKYRTAAKLYTPDTWFVFILLALQPIVVVFYSPLAGFSLLAYEVS